MPNLMEAFRQVAQAVNSLGAFKSMEFPLEDRVRIIVGALQYGAWIWGVTLQVGGSEDLATANQYMS